MTKRLMRSRWPDATAAHIAVSTAVHKGILPRAASLKCKDCGKQAREYDHYKGYAKKHRLHVQAICTSCHGKRMNKRGERIVPRGKAHWSYTHGLQSRVNAIHKKYGSRLRSKLSPADLETVREYHREYMRQRRGFPRLNIHRKRKRIGPLRKTGAFFSSTAMSQQRKVSLARG